jgi:hypothetical protein
MKRVAGLIALGIACAAPSVQAQTNFVASEIPLREWPDDLFFEDMDGNGRKDLIVPNWSANAGRELSIYLQQDNGSFPSTPSRLVEIKPEIIAISMADVRADEPGKELLLFSSTAVFSLSSAIPSYSGNLKPLFEWELVASVPDRRRILYFPYPHDLDGDGYVDLLLPGREDYAVFRGGPNETFTLSHRFNTVNEELDPSEVPLGSARLNTEIAINERDGIVMSVTARSNSAFEGFVSDWTTTNQDALLSTRQWHPSATTNQLSDDQRQDIVYMNIGNDLYGQINILLQDSNGDYAAKPDWQGPIDTRGDIRLLDANNDGMSDVLRIINNSNEWDVQFFLNKGAAFDLQKPDQIMKFSGYDLEVSVLDLDSNGGAQLSVSYYTIPVINAVRNASIVRSQLLFSRGSNGQLFNTRPDFKLDENFSADTVRGLSSQIEMQTDIDGDGRKDAVYVSNDGTLAAKAIDSSLRFADTPFWQYVPSRTILDFGIEDMNGDGIADLFLYHSTGLTILVSNP